MGAISAFSSPGFFQKTFVTTKEVFFFLVVVAFSLSVSWSVGGVCSNFSTSVFFFLRGAPLLLEPFYEVGGVRQQGFFL